MALLRDIFEQNKSAPKTVQQRGPIPTEQVSKLRQQGLTNDQIIQTLQRERFTLDQISTAINMVDAKEGVEGIVLGKENTQAEEREDMPPPLDMPPPMEEPAASMGQVPGFGMQQPGEISPEQEEKLQELAEAIIEEKWNELIQNVNKIVTWKNATENRVTKLEEDIKELRESFDKLHQGVLERIGSYDQSIKEVGTEIRALEKVFQKILPGFVENVNELSRITKGMKQQGK